MESNSIVALSRQYYYCKQHTRGRTAGNHPSPGAEGDRLCDHGCLPPSNAAIWDLSDLAPSQVVIVEGCFLELMRIENCQPPF